MPIPIENGAMELANLVVSRLEIQDSRRVSSDLIGNSRDGGIRGS